MRAGAGLLALAALLAAGCGYALVGHGVTSDASIKRIGVPLFKDTTGKPGLDQKITEKVIEELLKRGRFDVVQDATGVDALVEGELVTYRSIPVGFSGGAAGAAVPSQTQTEASRYAIVLTARVKYRKPGATEAIWESEALSFRDEYDVGEDSESYFDREDQAIERLAVAFARSLVSQMLEAF